VAAAATRPVIVGKSNYRRLLESGTGKPGPKGWEVRGATNTGAALPVTSDEKGALPVARRRKG